jgi:ABC-2 type transport system permease protein
MRLLKLLWGMVLMSIQRKLAHRADLLFEAALTTIGTVSGLLALAIIFSYTPTLAGWRQEEAITLLGMFLVVSGLLDAFVRPNLDWFEGKVYGGQFDDLLLQPAPSLFLASLGTCEPWALFQVAIGLGVIGMGVASVAAGLSLANVCAALLLLVSGVVITWASRVLLACLAFWVPGSDPTVLYDAFWQLGRYPVTIYQPAVRALLTYVVPVAFITTIPARALTRGVDLPLLAGGLLAGLGAFLVARLVWGRGLRRYTSATS